MSRWSEALARFAGRGRGAVARLQVGAGGLRWQGGDAVAPVSLSWENPPAGDVEWGDAFERLAAELPGTAGDEVEVLVDDGLCRWWVVEVPDALTRLDDLRALAQASLAGAYGLDSAAWVVDCEAPRLLAAWRRPPDRLACCALPRPLLAALRDAATAHRWRLRRIASPGALACAAWLASVAVKDAVVEDAGAARLWWAHLSPGHALLAVAKSGPGRHAPRLLALHPAWPDNGKGPAWSREVLAEEVHRLALLMGVPPPPRVQVQVQVQPGGDGWPGRQRAAAAAPVSWSMRNL